MRIVIMHMTGMRLRETTRAPRRGMAFIWVITTVAIIAALTAVAAPYLVTGVDNARYAETAATLRTLATGIASFETSVQDGQKASVHNYPGQISQLSSVIVAGDRNSCQVAMTTAIPSKGTSSDSITWLAAGPFVPFMVPSTGLAVPIGMVLDSIPNRGPTPGTNPVYVLITGVSAADAAAFDTYIDNGLASNDTVTVLHTAVNDTTTIRIRLLSPTQVVSGIC